MAAAKKTATEAMDEQALEAARAERLRRLQAGEVPPPIMLQHLQDRATSALRNADVLHQAQVAREATVRGGGRIDGPIDIDLLKANAESMRGMRAQQRNKVGQQHEAGVYTGVYNNPDYQPMSTIPGMVEHENTLWTSGLRSSEPVADEDRPIEELLRRRRLLGTRGPVI